MNLLHELPPGPDTGSGDFDPSVIYVAVEVPKGSRNKYEYDKRQGFVKLDLLGIPAVYVYAPDGERRYRLTADDPYNQFTDEDVEDAIQELLAASSL